MRRGIRRRETIALMGRVHAHLRANPGELFDRMHRALFPIPNGVNGNDLTSALTALKNDGKVRYVARSAVPFDPVATHCGWWCVSDLEADARQLAKQLPHL